MFVYGDPNRKWVTEGTIVAASPIVAYLLNFLYEVGFGRYYGIPLSFIAINWYVTLVLAAVIALLAVPLFWVYSSIAIYFSQKDNLLFRSAWKMLPFVVFFLVLLTLFGLEWRVWLWYFFFLGLLLFLEFGLPLLTQTDKKSYLEKLVDQERLEQQVVIPFEFALEKLGRLGRIYSLAVILGAAGAYYTGLSSAMYKTEFLVIEQPAESVILRMYGDRLICAPFDRDKGEVQRHFFLIKEGDDPLSLFKLEPVGPLRPV